MTGEAFTRRRRDPAVGHLGRTAGDARRSPRAIGICVTGIPSAEPQAAIGMRRAKRAGIAAFAAFIERNGAETGVGAVTKIIGNRQIGTAVGTGDFPYAIKIPFHLAAVWVVIANLVTARSDIASRAAVDHVTPALGEAANPADAVLTRHVAKSSPLPFRMVPHVIHVLIALFERQIGAGFALRGLRRRAARRITARRIKRCPLVGARLCLARLALGTIRIRVANGLANATYLGAV